MLQSILWLYRLMVALVVGALVYDYYAPTGLTNDFTSSLYMTVAVLVLAEPLFWALMHLCGGIMMGVAAGGLLDGMKLSLIIGVGFGTSRLWPAFFGAGVGAYAGGGPLIYSIGGVLIGLALLGLERGMYWMWYYSRNE